MKSIYKKNFEKLVELQIITTNGKPTFKYGIMFMCTQNCPEPEVYSKDDDVIVIGHFYNENGEHLPDPEIVIQIGNKMVKGLSYHQEQREENKDEVPDTGFLDVVYREGKLVSQVKKDGVNGFLGAWLQKLIDQGYAKVEYVSPDT